MKRFFATIVVLAITLSTFTTQAQERGDVQVRGSLGFLSFPDYVGILIVGFGSLDTNDNIERNDFLPLLNPTIEVDWWLNSHIALGGSLSLGYAKAQSSFADSGATSRRIAALYPTLTFSALTRYFTTNKFSMYGSWGLGAMGFFTNQYDSDNGGQDINVGIAPMGNLYPVCFKFGDKTSFFAELGWGAKGIVNIGGSFRF